MGRTMLTVDASSIKDTLVDIITAGFDKAFKHMTGVNEKLFQQLSAVLSAAMNNDKPIGGDISGLREQITANVQVLLPVIGTSHGLSFKLGNRFAVAPDIHVITAGQEPKIKAYVLQGGVTCCNKFIDADAGVNAAEALNNLLVLTQQMLDFHSAEIGNHSANDSSDDNESDLGGWDSASHTNHASTFGLNGDGNRSTHSGGSNGSGDSAIGGLTHAGSPFVASAMADSRRPASFYDSVTGPVFY